MLRSRKFTVREISIMVIVVAMVAIVCGPRNSLLLPILPTCPDHRSRFALGRNAHENGALFPEKSDLQQPSEPPCGAVESSVAPLPTDPNFTFTCPTLSATQFTVVATGTGSMLGFQYSIDQNNNRFTPSVPSAGRGPVLLAG